MNNIRYKVLWIDDEKEIVEGYQILADLRGIDLIHFTNWVEAEKIFDFNFNEWTGIVLDANCKWDAMSIPDKNFLRDVVDQINSKCSERQRLIPWYVLSAGTMNDFDRVIEGINTKKRQDYVEDWGELLYMKDDINNPNVQNPENNPLFNNICHVGESMSHNVVLFRHKDAFKYMGEDKLMSTDARKILLNALSVAYFPEKNISYEFAGNPLRKILEYMFRSANKVGLLPDEFFDTKKKVILWDSMQYLCGKNPSNIHFRYGMDESKPNADDAETVFPKTINYLLLNILNFVNTDSHTEDDDVKPYFIDINNKDLFFGFVFQLSHIISFFGDFCMSHTDVEANRRKKTIINGAEGSKGKSKDKSVKEESVTILKPEEVLGKIYSVLNAGTFKYAGPCKIDDGKNLQICQKVKIEDVINNDCPDKNNYPFIATKVSLV